MATEKIENPNEYGADQIQILEGLEAVRKRPGMYIGSTSARGLHHLVYEIVDNAVDEALAGYCKNIEVTINPDNSITVEDDGRGIPVGMNHKAGKSALEVVYTVLHAGGKFGGGGYKVSGGLHGVGASVVNALSTKLCVEVYKEGQVYFQSYHIGKPDEPVKVIGTCDSEKHGTKVTFHPDPEIFEETVYDYDTLKQRLRETAFLTKGLRIVLTDTREESHHCHEFHYAGGIKEFVTYLNRSKEALYPDVIYCEGTRDGVYVEVAMQHNDSYNDATYSFVNNIITPEGGTHLAGFRNALTKTFNTYARANKILKDSEPALTGDDIREGLTAIISIKIEEPQFEGQTKQKLGNSDVAKTRETLEKAGIENPYIQILNVNNDQQKNTKSNINSIISIRTKFIDKGSTDQDKITEQLKTEYTNPELISVSSVGPTMGKELFKNSLIAVTLAFLGIVAYLSFRFRFDYALAAILGVLHDVIFVCGMFSILGLVYNVQIDGLFITAILTVIGFSVHDTIVVFDRIRENLRYYSKKMSFGEIVDASVNQTLTRSINTSLTTLITLLALYFFGGVTTRDFVLAMILGIAIGTYSSIFFCSMLVDFWNDKQQTKTA